MAAGQKKRQKKLERRSAKRKQRQKTLVKQSQRGLREQLASAAMAPVLHCEVSETLQENRLGQVLLSRELPNGNVAFGVFLVDLSCLGVKDAFGNVTHRTEYDRFRSDLRDRYKMFKVSPADLRNLVEGAVGYANDLGLVPHADYSKINPIFGDIDPSEATEHFEFGGTGGKPHFIAGPHDDAIRCQRIMSILEHSCGKDGFHFTIPFPGAIPDSMQDDSQFLESDED